MYTDTQRELANHGIKEVTVYRGMKTASKEIKLGQSLVDAAYKMNPLSSFSTSFSMAKAFGKWVFATSVPAERIFSWPHTGPGCNDEKELLVIGGKLNTKAGVSYSHPQYGKH